MFNNTSPNCPDVAKEEGLIGSFSALGAVVLGFLASFVFNNRKGISKWIMSKINNGNDLQPPSNTDRKSIELIFIDNKDLQEVVITRTNSSDSEISIENNNNKENKIIKAASKEFELDQYRGRQKTVEAAKQRFNSEPPNSRFK